jgi:hypothetical protein
LGVEIKQGGDVVGRRTSEEGHKPTTTVPQEPTGPEQLRSLEGEVMARPVEAARVDQTFEELTGIIGQVRSLVHNRPPTIFEALKSLREISGRFRQILLREIAPVLNAFKGQDYPDLEAKRDVAADTNATLRDLGLRVADPETKLPGNLQARPGENEPQGRFNLDFATPEKRTTRSLSVGFPEVELTLAPTENRRGLTKKKST